MKKNIFIFSIILIILIYFNSHKIIDQIYAQKKLINIYKKHLPEKYQLVIRKSLAFYNHKMRKKMVFKNTLFNDEITSNKENKYLLSIYTNNMLKKKRHGSYLEIYDDNLFLITRTGIISFTNSNFSNKKDLHLKIIRTNLNDLLGWTYIARWPILIWDLLILNDKIYISYLKEIKKDCFNTSVFVADLNYKKIIFKELFAPDECVERYNSYGLFDPIAAGGAMSSFSTNNILLGVGEFKFRDLAQDPKSIFGKILKINVNTGEFKIISMGHRNQQGLHYDKSDNIIYSTEHGPRGGGEININLSPTGEIENYGWPVSSYGEHYAGKEDPRYKKEYERAPLYKSHKDYGFIEPLKYFTPSVAPSEISIIPSNFNNVNEKQISMVTLGHSDVGGRRAIHFFSLNNDFTIKTKTYDIVHLKRRIRDMVYADKLNKIFLFLDFSGSISVLDRKK